MATGHILKLQKRLAERTGAATSHASAKQASMVPLQSPVRERIDVTAPNAPNLDSPSTSIALGTGTGSLLDGEYDEAAAAADFREAVRAWREGPSRPPKPANPVADSRQPAIAHQVRQEAVQSKNTALMHVLLVQRLQRRRGQRKRHGES